MDAPAVNQSDILCRSVVALKDLHIVLLNHPRLLGDAVIRVGKNTREKLLPFGITESIVVKKFQLVTQVPGQVFFFMNLQILVTLPGQQGYELVLEVGFGLVGFRSRLRRGVFGHYCRLFCRGENIICTLGHEVISSSIKAVFSAFYF